MNTDELEDEAERLLDGGKLRRAERVLKQMLAINANCLAAHFQLARVYRRTKKYDLALRHARRTLRLSPNERNACLNLGLIYDLMDNRKLAAFYYKKELSRNFGSPETHWNIGCLYFEKRQWLRASKHLRYCFENAFKPHFEDATNKLAICYHKLHDVRSYIDVFTEYVQIVPNAAWAFTNLGRALLAVKDYKSAVLRLTTAQRLGNRKSVVIELARAKDMLWKCVRRKSEKDANKLDFLC